MSKSIRNTGNSLTIHDLPSINVVDGQEDNMTAPVTPIARRKVMKHSTGSTSPSYHTNLALSMFEYEDIKYFRPLISDCCPPSVAKENIMKYDLLGVSQLLINWISTTRMLSFYNGKCHFMFKSINKTIT